MAMSLAILVSVGTAVLSADETPQKVNRPNAEQIRFFEKTIRPLLAKYCYECHGADVQESELRLDTLAGILTGGNAGASINPGKPKQSLLITAIGYRDNELQMPPDEKLSDRQIADLTRWVEMGAPHPDSGTVKVASRATLDIAKGRTHWAFQTPSKPNVPRGGPAESIENPIDAFVSEALAKKGLKPLGPADKRTLIRRATFDLIGLPPTPAEIDAFLADESDEAFRRVVDRLLDSPHYGERWGRHWLDIARYADSNGLDENVAHGNAWRYRDYVVQSLNNDKPYDEFVVEQLAGDQLDSGSDVSRRNDRLIATGFLALGPKVLAEVDESKMEMDIVDEQIDTIGRSLMGLTLGCARCHDHKFDPIGQDDYYGLAGIFKSTRTMESFKKVAKWQENLIALPEELARKEKHEQRISEKKSQIEDRIAKAKDKLAPPTGETVPQDLEKRFPQETQDELKKLRDDLKSLEKSVPVLPTAMGVVDGDIADAAVHLRGSHLTLGDVVPRHFPRVLCSDTPPSLPSNSSGRLEYAHWLTTPDHPLTARVMVNRIWRWHFGKGLVSTVDNFGLQGQPPTHPKLLDWLAVRFVEEDWSIKAMHRLIMLSAAYQRSSGFDSHRAAVDPDNLLYWRFDVRRLEAETIRDALLATSGTLDRTLGGNLLAVKNRDYLFDHTSQDKSNYDIRRRSIYVPVIRNHLYDVFQLFDYTDASVLNGNRNTSTIAPQALFLMNSQLAIDLTTAMADRLLDADGTRKERVTQLFLEAYGRPPTEDELTRADLFLTQFMELTAQEKSSQDNVGGTQQAWQALCQSVISSSEFIYVR
ncbi:Planctomycete cytochrome C [Symmachiella macrocystis]|uniref:Planctomycete cytochrome C n=1 Tax=Symmachiella macrocystis TaxID=2527985 RepID=A0A5C6B0D6_9PLAN|nr:PSD1 and planctomycete cytochrome C domain-containing protein [Symmachiella macrocystis]TWU05237.1 Planctomycete cytochrome C [Symmachiella macrocystis]